MAARRDRDGAEEGFTLVELMVAGLVLVIVMFSLTYVLVNALADTAYARQRSAATNLANQTVEEIRSLPWSTLQLGMKATDLSGDANLAGTCFEGNALDVAAVVGPACAASSASWADPACLSHPAARTVPSASSLRYDLEDGVYWPVSPHEQCWLVGGRTYAVDVYITGVPGTSYLTDPAPPPLTATVVVSWAHPVRSGLSTYVVTTTELTSCLKGGGSQCAGTG